MTIEQWLEDARMDAFRRQLPELAALLESLAKSTAALRAADWNEDAAGMEGINGIRINGIQIQETET